MASKAQLEGGASDVFGSGSSARSIASVWPSVDDFRSSPMC